VPEDVSVIGFDDIQVAAYHNPASAPSGNIFRTWEKPPLASFCNVSRDSKTIL